jgi:hypothetical protein
MSDIIPFNSQLPAYGGNRKLGRALARLERDTTVELARTHAVEMVEAAKVEAIEAVGHVGLSSVAALSAAELFYAERDPHAIARLKYTADTASCAIAQRIDRLNRRLG